MGDRIPSQVFDEQVICCWIDDPVGVEMRHKMNVDMICWECDYPHSDSTWPQSPEAVWKQMQAANVSDAEIDKMSHANAMRLYNYDPFSVLGGRGELQRRRAACPGRGLGREHRRARYQGIGNERGRPGQVRQSRPLGGRAPPRVHGQLGRALYFDNTARSMRSSNGRSSSSLLARYPRPGPPCWYSRRSPAAAMSGMAAANSAHEALILPAEVDAAAAARAHALPARASPAPRRRR